MCRGIHEKRTHKKKLTNHCWLGIQTHGQYCELPPYREAWCIAGEEKTKKRVMKNFSIPMSTSVTARVFLSGFVKPGAADRVNLSLYATFKTLDQKPVGHESFWQGRLSLVPSHYRLGCTRAVSKSGKDKMHLVGIIISKIIKLSTCSRKPGFKGCFMKPLSLYGTYM